MGHPASLHAMQAELDQKRAELKALFDGCRQADGELKMSGEQIAEARKRNDELEQKGKAFQEAYSLHAMDQAVQEKGGPRLDDTAPPMPDAVQAKGRGPVIDLKDIKAGDLRSGIALPGVDLKTLMATSAGWSPESVRDPGYIVSAQRPIELTDLIPSRPTNQAAIKFMYESTFTNNAAERSEGGTYGEAALALTEATAIVETIGVWLPISDEQMEDVEEVEGYINDRLPFMVRQRLDYQTINGNGVTPNVRGVANVSGLQTQAKGGDPTPDAIHKALTKVRVTGRATPSAVVIHPSDWEEIKLLRTADGVYIWGNPSQAGPTSIWGVPVVESSSCTAGTAYVGDWARYAALRYRRGLNIKVTDAHSDYFINGKQAIRCDIRAAIVWYRGAAFCSVTGI